MEKRHLIRALAGNYGYVRGPAVETSFTIQASSEGGFVEAVEMSPTASTQPEEFSKSDEGQISMVSAVCVFPLFSDLSC